MTLKDVVQNLDALAKDLTICVDRTSSWSPDAHAEICARDVMRAKQNKLPYFLEVFIARDVLEAWSYMRDGQDPTLLQKCEALIFYAQNDAYLLPEHDSC